MKNRNTIIFISIIGAIIVFLIGYWFLFAKPFDKEAIQKLGPYRLPDAPVFSDEKTKPFIYSTEEVTAGTYLLEPMSESFTIHFPERGKVTAAKEKDGKESLEFFLPYRSNENQLFHVHMWIDDQLDEFSFKEKWDINEVKWEEERTEEMNMMTTSFTEESTLWERFDEDDVERKEQEKSYGFYFIIEDRASEQEVYGKVTTFTGDKDKMKTSIGLLEEEVLKWLKTIQFHPGQGV